MYTSIIESIGVWQYIIRSALLPRTYLCPVKLPTVVYVSMVHELVRYMKSVNMHGEKIKEDLNFFQNVFKTFY